MDADEIVQLALRNIERKSDRGEVPPAGAQSAGKRALQLIKDGRAGGGFTATGKARAAQLARGDKLGEATIRRMHSYFSRHSGDKKPGWSDAGSETPGYVAWLAWGGDAGASWAAKMVRKWDGESKSIETYNFMGTPCKSVDEVAETNRISKKAAAFGILQSPDASNLLRALAMKALHAYQGEHSTDVMIAFEIEDDVAAQLALPDGDPPEELHITLGYFGEASNTITRESMLILAHQLAREVPPMDVLLNGIGRFSSEDGDDACVVLIDHPLLPSIYTRMLDLANELQVNYQPSHGYTPHLTLGWLNREAKMPTQRWTPIKVRIASIALHYGNDVHPIPLSWHGSKMDDPQPLPRDEQKDVHTGNGGRRKRRKEKPVVLRARSILGGS